MSMLIHGKSFLFTSEKKSLGMIVSTRLCMFTLCSSYTYSQPDSNVGLYLDILWPICIYELWYIFKTFFQVNDKLIFLCFFIGAIICLAFSTLFHTVSCHSKSIQNIFSRMDYAGIALLIGKLWTDDKNFLWQF